MVQFPGSRLRTLCIQILMHSLQLRRLPHSAIPGSMDVCSSPGLIAAYHGLPRQVVPRHPPQTLIHLTILIFTPSLLLYFYVKERNSLSLRLLFIAIPVYSAGPVSFFLFRTL
jgi:hypothetical protein